MCRSKLSSKNVKCFKAMFLVLVDSNGERVDDRCWDLNEAKAALEASEECGIKAHLEVRSITNESFVSTNK